MIIVLSNENLALGLDLDRNARLLDIMLEAFHIKFSSDYDDDTYYYYFDTEHENDIELINMILNNLDVDHIKI